MSGIEEEAIEVTRDLIRLDTTNYGHEGSETLAAAFLRDYLTDAGVEAELVAREPERANIVARIPGTDPDAPSLAFVGHTDVVPTEGQDWTHPPFEAVVDDDGFLYGRGAIDMKNEVATRAVAMAHLAREGFRPRGDLWFIAVADEGLPRRPDGKVHFQRVHAAFGDDGRVHVRSTGAQGSHQGWVCHYLAFRYRANGIDDARRSAGFTQVAAGTRFENIQQHIFRRIHRQHQYPRIGILLDDAACRFNAVDAGQMDVHDDDIGLTAADLRDGSLARRRFRYHRHVRMLFDHGPHTRAQQVMIIDQHDA